MPNLLTQEQEILGIKRFKQDVHFTSLFYGIKTVSETNYTITDIDNISLILVSTAGSHRTITLPAIANNIGRIITAIKIDSGTGEVIIDGEGSEEIEGFATLRLINQYDWISIVGGD